MVGRCLLLSIYFHLFKNNTTFFKNYIQYLKKIIYLHHTYGLKLR